MEPSGHLRLTILQSSLYNRRGTEGSVGKTAVSSRLFESLSFFFHYIIFSIVPGLSRMSFSSGCKRILWKASCHLPPVLQSLSVSSFVGCTRHPLAELGTQLEQSISSACGQYPGIEKVKLHLQIADSAVGLQESHFGQSIVRKTWSVFVKHQQYHRPD